MRLNHRATCPTADRSSLMDSMAQRWNSHSPREPRNLQARGPRNREDEIVGRKWGSGKLLIRSESSVGSSRRQRPTWCTKPEDGEVADPEASPDSPLPSVAGAVGLHIISGSQRGRELSPSRARLRKVREKKKGTVGTCRAKLSAPLDAFFAFQAFRFAIVRLSGPGPGLLGCVPPHSPFQVYQTASLSLE